MAIPKLTGCGIYLLVQQLLTTENYQKGFLLDEEWMGGVSQDSDQFAAFVMNHSTGEYVDFQKFSDLNIALRSINAIARSWQFEATSECGNCEEGGCGKGACKQSCQTTGVCELEP